VAGSVHSYLQCQRGWRMTRLKLATFGATLRSSSMLRQHSTFVWWQHQEHDLCAQGPGVRYSSPTGVPICAIPCSWCSDAPCCCGKRIGGLLVWAACSKAATAHLGHLAQHMALHWSICKLPLDTLYVCLIACCTCLIAVMLLMVDVQLLCCKNLV
jgi:hypothetical protein